MGNIVNSVSRIKKWYNIKNMKTYTTKKGDTLSGVAQMLGVAQGDISGYKSGDPNKIQIGEVLNIKTPEDTTSSYAEEVKKELSTPKETTSLYDTEKIKQTISYFGAKEEEAFKGLQNAKTDLWNKGYTDKGLSEIKTKIADIDQKIADKKAEITQGESDIKSNTRWSSARMSGKVKKMTDTANAELNNLIAERNSLATNYNDSLKEIDTDVSNKLSDKQTEYSYYTKQKEAAQKLLDSYVSALKDELKSQKEESQLDKKLASALEIAKLRTGGSGTKKGLQFVTANSGRRQFVFDPNTGAIQEITTGKKSSNVGDEDVVFDENTLPQETTNEEDNAGFLQGLLSALGL